MKKNIIISIIILVIMASCNNLTNRNSDRGFVRSKEILKIIDDEIDSNLEKKIIMLVFITKNDSNYIFSYGTNKPPIPVLRELDDINEKYKTFDIPFYKYRGYYIISASIDFKLDINDFLFTDSLKHNPQEINNLRPKTDEEFRNSIRRPIYNVYYINSEYDIIYLGKRNGWTY